MSLFNPSIPAELLLHKQSDNDISILIGENGSGKSQMLTRLIHEYEKQRKK